MRHEIAGGVKYFASPLIARVKGIKHAFPCRSGAKDEPLDRLRKRMMKTFGVKAFLTVKQVHGTDVLIYDGTPEGATAYRTRSYDAIITSTRGLAAGVRTADCLPVLIASPGVAVAAIHCGWKGLLGGMIEKTVEKICERYNVDPLKLVASTGPHIVADCYEVGPDVAEPFMERFGEDVLKPGKEDRSFLNLEAATRTALSNAGLISENIDHVHECTLCQKNLFYSYRRDGKPTGRQLSFIQLDCV